MKAKQQHQKQYVSYKTKAALLAGALAVSLLAGCGASESEAVVTVDDLTPASAAQDALLQEAGSGKTYRYFWPAEDPQRGEEWARGELEAAYEEALADPANSGEEAKARLQERLEMDYENFMSERETQSQLTPTVSAQEAANLAGRMLEQVYGADLAATSTPKQEPTSEWTIMIGILPRPHRRLGPAAAMRCLRGATTGSGTSIARSLSR